jgi:hypothetical protein
MVQAFGVRAAQIRAPSPRASLVACGAAPFPRDDVYCYPLTILCASLMGVSTRPELMTGAQQAANLSTPQTCHKCAPTRRTRQHAVPGPLSDQATGMLASPRVPKGCAVVAVRMSSDPELVSVAMRSVPATTSCGRVGESACGSGRHGRLLWWGGSVPAGPVSSPEHDLRRRTGMSTRREEE